MSALHRKLLRDLWQMKGQAVAICLVIASAASMAVMSLSMRESLGRTQAAYYDRYRFADVFTHLKRAPNSLAGRIEDIPGVARVQTRIVAAVTLDVPKLSEPAKGRLISVPDRRVPTLNDVHLRSGRWVEPGRAGEVMVSEAFAEAHAFKSGDSVKAVLNGRLQELHIVGVVLSPEYVYQLPEGEVFPDDRRFGVFWMAYTELAAAFDMQGAFNDVSLTLTPEASEPEVLRRLDRLTEPYGGLGAYGRYDQVSHRFLSDEIAQLRIMGTVMPSIFLGVAAFLLHVVMSRLVGTQREQIAALKAFGYSKWEVGRHYLEFVLVIVVVGVALGALFGVWLGHGLTGMYAKFYRFPLLEFHVSPAVLVLSLGVSAAAAVLGTAGAVRRAVELPPAQAMRPEPPASYRPTIVERIGLQRLFTQPARMILRNLERTPVKALLSVIGISLAVAILVVGRFSTDALDYMMEFQFDVAQRQDVTVTFVEPASSDALEEVRRLPGVVAAEPFRSVGVRLRHGHRSRRIGIMGLEPDARLFRVLDADWQQVNLPPAGLVLSQKLAELLDVRLGDVLTVEVMEGERPVREVPVTGLMTDFTGMGCYMNLHALNRLMREGRTVSGAFLTADAGEVEGLYRRLKNTPRVAGVGVKRAALKSFQDTIAESMGMIQFFYVLFACVIAFGVVYNNARISLSERSRELATLRVIGFTRAEISFILLGEMGVLTLAALPGGLLLGYGLVRLASWMLDTELYRIPPIIEPPTYAFAVTVVLIAAAVSGLIVRRKLDHLDLVSVLKSKE
jgi:putative ABC transport system permease protein